ncbi:hypothetical protein Tco_1555523 [Tanacetum coccineum]
MPTNLRIYDGFIDPDDHVSPSVGAVNQGEWQMPVWCRMFQQTLNGPARGWSDRLPNGCIDNWPDSREMFIERIALRRRCFKDPTEVSKIIRKVNETLADFKERWTDEMSYIKMFGSDAVISFNKASPSAQIAQKRRVLGTEKSRVVMKEVDEWIKADILRPV